MVPRQGKIDYAPKVVASPTYGGKSVTGLRIGRGTQVTGDEPGATLPVSGTQYIGADGAAPRYGDVPKVGLARTPGGTVVSGTQTRRPAPMTGDEAGEHLPITGQAEAKLSDNLSPTGGGAYSSAQFPRRADPHGASVFGRYMGNSVRAMSGDSPSPLEITDRGFGVTGSAVGRSLRVTGNGHGACSAITGDQYQTLAEHASECSGTGGGTAPAEHLGNTRRDPVTGAKVGETWTWGGQRVTGPSVDHCPPVTGEEHGVCSVVTGTPYNQGPSTAYAWCEPDSADAAAERLAAPQATAAVTGDVAGHDRAVTGTGRGAALAITGTPYFRDVADVAPLDDPIAAIDQRFSVVSPPQRSAHLASDRDSDQTSTDAGFVTGSFAAGQDKVTGNGEFLFQPRQARDGTRPAITGEGRTEGREITGNAWAAHKRVTGTEAAGRNPSQRAGKPHGWAGAAKFTDQGVHEAGRQIVTGLSGWNEKAAGKVTVSGGAQG